MEQGRKKQGVIANRYGVSFGGLERDKAVLKTVMVMAAQP